MRFRGRWAWWGLAAGAVTGCFDMLLALSLGLDFSVAGRDLTIPVGLYLAGTFAALGGALGYFVDARARARADARTIQEQLEALERTRRAAAHHEKLAAIGRLAAGVAHEVRNPLGVIRASASMVQESFARDEEPYRACAFICEEIDRLNGLITALLGFARPSAPRFQTVSLEKVIERALQIEAGALEERGVVVERSALGSVPDVSADPDLLAQLVLGLLTNALEAVGEGGRIALRLRADADAVRLEVADDGPGIAAEDAERVFEPFFTTKDAGTGLGLAMAARIVETHGGAIEVVGGAGAGPEGRGACFRMQLPIPEEAAP